MIRRGRTSPLLVLALALPLAACETLGIAPPTNINPAKITLDNKLARLDEASKAIQSSVDSITPQDERAVGQASSFKVISESGGLLLDSALVTYVNEVGNLVAQQGHRIAENGKPPRTKARRFFFGVLDDDSMNAYSLPGGYVYVTRGLLENLTSESELAWVLGHEITHVDHEHNLKALKQQAKGKAAAREFLDITGVAGSGGASAVDMKSEKFFGFLAGKLADIQLKLGMDKEQETDADRTGLDSAVAAGYDARGAERVLQTLASNPGRTRSFFNQHATPEQRLADLRPKIEELEKAHHGKIGQARYENRGFATLQMAVAEKSAAKKDSP